MIDPNLIEVEEVLLLSIIELFEHFNFVNIIFPPMDIISASDSE